MQGQGHYSGLLVACRMNLKVAKNWKSTLCIYVKTSQILEIEGKIPAIRTGQQGKGGAEIKTLPNSSAVPLKHCLAGSILSIHSSNVSTLIKLEM